MTNIFATRVLKPGIKFEIMLEVVKTEIHSKHLINNYF